MNRKRAGPPGVYIHQSLLRSRAFLSLSAIDIRVLFTFLSKRRIAGRGMGKRRSKKTVVNNGEIEFSFAEAEASGLSRSTFSLALRRLQERGFVTCVEAGGLNQGLEKRCTKWSVNVAAEDEPEQPWMEWRPPSPKGKDRDCTDTRTNNLKQFRSAQGKRPPHSHGMGPSQNPGDGRSMTMGRGPQGDNSSTCTEVVHEVEGRNG